MNCVKAFEMAHELMAQHGVGHWSLKWSGAHRILGTCYYDSETIAISKPLTRLNDEKLIRNTILHEIAHALNPDEGHGLLWQKCVEGIGGVAEVTCPESRVVMPIAKFEYECPACGYRSFRQRRLVKGAFHTQCGRENGKMRLVKIRCIKPEPMEV